MPAESLSWSYLFLLMVATLFLAHTSVFANTQLRGTTKTDQTQSSTRKDDHFLETSTPLPSYPDEVVAAAAVATASELDRSKRNWFDLDEPTSYFETNSLDAKFNSKITFDDYLTYSMRALNLIAGFDTDSHRYDSKSDLLNSFKRNHSSGSSSSSLNNFAPLESEANHILPVPIPSDSGGGTSSMHSQLVRPQNLEDSLIENEKNQLQCGLQLDELLRESKKLFENFDSYSNSKNLNLINFLDSFGSPNSQLLKGNSMWLGSYEQCKRSQLSLVVTSGGGGLTSQNKKQEEQYGQNKYCVAKYRSPSWSLLGISESKQIGAHSLKLGVCLPEACNSISLSSPSRNHHQVDQLIKLTKLNQIPYSGYKLIEVYCLPDENSPLRQFHSSAKLFILFLSSWLTLVVYFSLKYEYLRMNWMLRGRSGRIENEEKEVGKDEEEFHLNLDNSLKIFAFRFSLLTLFGNVPIQRGLKQSKTPQQVNNENNTHLNIESNNLPQVSFPKQNNSNHKNTLNLNEPKIKFSLVNDLKLTYELLDKLAADEQIVSGSGSVSVSNITTDSGGTSGSVSASSTIEDFSLRNQNLPKTLMTQNILDEMKFRDTETPRQDACTVSVNPLDDIVCANLNMAKGKTAKTNPKIDLSALDGIKVISMIWLIAAHTLLFFVRTIANGRDFWSMQRDARFLTVMAGIFPVDTFFTVTGILTAYLKFNKNDGKEMKKISYWLEAFVHRYLRFMPMYLIVFWYTRDISEYIGHGPLWDYATADTSLRSVCKQESVTVPLLFQANFKPLDQHCIKPAWYLANDYQYLLITPIFMALLIKSRSVGYFAICLSVISSLVMQFLTVFYSTEVKDFAVLINFKPMFATYVLKDLWKLYVLPYNRLPPYLIGLFTGHMMYNMGKKLEQREQLDHKRIWENNNKNNQMGFQSKNLLVNAQHHHILNNNNKTTVSASDCLESSSYSLVENSNKSSMKHNLIQTIGSYICIKVWTPLVFLISIIYLPMSTTISTTPDGLLAKIGTSSIIALMRFIWSIAIARLIYICATRFIDNVINEPPKVRGIGKDIIKTNTSTLNVTTHCDSFVVRFLSSGKWKPWSKIGLSALLIQWEVISYLAQSQASIPNMSITFLVAVILVCIVATYLVALVIYLTVEFPLSQIEHLYIHPTLFNKS